MRGQLVFVAWLLASSGWAGERKADNLDAVWQSLVLEAAGICPRLQRRVSDEARLAAVQRAILDGLGLDEPPPFPTIPPPSLPPPLVTPPSTLYQVFDRITLSPSDTQCSVDEKGKVLRLSYKLPSSLKTKTLSLVKLLLYTGCKEDSSELREPVIMSYILSLSECFNMSTYEMPRPFTGSKYVIGEWVELNLKTPIMEMIRKGIKCAEVNLHLSGPLKIPCPIASIPESRPYLSVEYENNPKERKKRGHECRGNYSECCREDFFISFKEIKWDQWVVGPATYNAYICRGNCSNATAVTISASRHHSNINRVRLSGSRSDVPMSCCAPTKLGGDRFIVNYPNGSLIHSYIDNIIVKSCGCH